MNWYINRKTNELVQAIWLGEGAWANNCWGVRDKDDNWLGYLKDADFQSQYGEAMINNQMIPADDKPHIKDKFCDNLGCIPYIPEQEQADEEPVFPVCGTCNAQKEQDLTKGELKFYNTKPDSSLLLSEMKAVEKAIELQKYSEDEGYVLMPADYYRAGMVAELDHLAKLGIVYVKEKINLCAGLPAKIRYITLSDYIKGEGK